MKVFVVTKVLRCRPLTLLKLTLSLICFKNSAKISTMCFRKWLTNRRDIVANILGIFNTWWTISNSKKRFSPNILGNTVINRDKKTEFLRTLADWIEQWCQSPALTLTPQTASALTSALTTLPMLCS